MVAHVLSSTARGGGGLQRAGVGAAGQVHKRLAIAAMEGRVKIVTSKRVWCCLGITSHVVVV